MTTESRSFVRVPTEAVDTVLGLEDRSLQALARANKAPVGDRTDIVRFERAQTDIEALAIVAANGGAPVVRDDSPPSDQERTCVVDADRFPDDITAATADQVKRWLDDGSVVVEVVTPFDVGTTIVPAGSGAPLPVAEVWQSAEGNRGKDAVRERFLDQLAAAARSAPDSPVAISPSGVSNTVLTEGLRTFAAQTADSAPILAPVAYRDGSAARPFPLRALNLIDDRSAVGRVLSFSLLSIRHTALDRLVHGAWLRNTEVSRPRPAGDTDEFVYLESVRQIERLCAESPTTIVMYQTGLETAIVGFYRAVAEYLAVHPDRLAVLPRFFQRGADYEEGQAWRVK